MQVISIMVMAEAIVIALSCSLDAFTAGFSYGSNRIYIPWRSAQTINIICTLTLGLSIFVGSKIVRFLPGRLAVFISFGILFILGMTKLLDSITKFMIRKHNRQFDDCIQKKYEFSMFNFRFILRLYADPEAADVDASKTLSAKEAVALAVSLSLDGIAVGFGAALGSVFAPAVIAASLIANTLAIRSGCWLGNRIARLTRFNISWVSGAILMLLGFSKLF